MKQILLEFFEPRKDTHCKPSGDDVFPKTWRCHPYPPMRPKGSLPWFISMFISTAVLQETCSGQPPWMALTWPEECACMGETWRCLSKSSLCYSTVLKSPSRAGFVLCWAQFLLCAKKPGRLGMPQLPLEISIPFLNLSTAFFIEKLLLSPSKCQQTSVMYLKTEKLIRTIHPVFYPLQFPCSLWLLPPRNGVHFLSLWIWFGLLMCIGW